ncbi:restriction endonuclease subunit S [Staphylococcus haemolyticus]|uniref:restriction endonuclease subunit S n=1 Tax=Staphylococcus haemolyticus TaxID=1283 RepID=UPI0034D6CED8
MEFKLKDIAHINQETLKKDSFPNNFLYLDTKNLTSGKFGELVYFDTMKDKVPSRARRIVKENDILISTVRPNQRHYGFITKDQESYIVSTGFAVITPDETKVNPYFLYKYLTLENITNYLQSIAENSTSAYPAIKPSVLSELSIILPDKTIQGYISKLLRSLDDKMNLNEQIIANLEKLSQTLFKHWFVDFEFPDKNGNPYKSSGGEMVDSELGEIPKGWRVETLEKLGSIVGGGTPSKKNKEYYTNNGIPWITPKDLSKNRNIYISHGENDISELGLNKSSAKLLEKNSVLFSSRAPIGYIAINNIPVTTNQGFKSIVPNEEMNPYFIYFILKNITPLIEQTASGSTFKEISAKGLKSIKIVFPSIELIEHYGNIVKKYFEEINFLENQNIKLIELRDTLLPKLMSGEIEIPDDIEVNNDELSI